MTTGRGQFHLWQHRSGVWYLLYGERLKRRISTGHKDRAMAEQVKADMEVQFGSRKAESVALAGRGHRRRNADLDGEVYFIYAPEVSRLKIGWATSLGDRVGQIESLSPVKVVLLGTIPGSRQTERFLHQFFSKRRLHGEWFSADEDFIKAIKEILKGPTPCAASVLMSKSPRRS